MRRERGDEGEASGELNLVPYLDIVVNTVVFLLATTASALPLANIDVLAPEYVPPSEARGETPAVETGLQLTVTVSYRGFIVAGAGGVMRSAEGTLPTIRCREHDGDRCAARWASGAWRDGYDYAALEALARRIKARYPDERTVTLVADARVPYQVVVRTLDTLRGRPADHGRCRLNARCLFDRVALAAGLQ
jgi:biopolymer transport protein ExbD